MAVRLIGDFMKYKVARLKACPICGAASKVYFTGDICHKCGADIRNRCEKCEAVLDSSARYCNYCGNESLYYSLSILKSWQSEREERYD